MSTDLADRATQLQALHELLLPLAGFCLRRSLSIQDFINQAKLAFLEIGEQEIRRTGKKPNVSRLSVLTGMYRADVHRLHKDKDLPTAEPLNVLGKVLGQWAQDRRFCSSAGQPRILSFRGDDNEFRDLVGTVSKTINSGTVLFELERRGLVLRTPKGLKHSKRMLSVRLDSKKTFISLGREIDAYIRAVEENILPEERIDNLHIHTQYDNIFEKDVPKIRKWLVLQGRMFHRRVRKFLANYDKDMSPSLRATQDKAGVVVQVGTFSFTHGDGPSKKQS